MDINVYYINFRLYIDIKKQRIHSLVVKKKNLFSGAFGRQSHMSKAIGLFGS